MSNIKEQTNTSITGNLSIEDFKNSVLNDYRIAIESREASLLGRREVLTGKAKFGIFGDGKELPQIALAKQFVEGDFRSGYYRDQTWMFASEITNLDEWFAQLYANTDLSHDPASGGRQMNSHFATRSLNEDGTWKDLTKMKNTTSDISPTAGQMPRLLGLGLASKLYRQNKGLSGLSQFSDNGNEVAWGSIGDASTSEGHFWETMNAAGVLQIPIVMSVWDDGHGISVPKKYQTIKESISDALSGFAETDEKPGFYILKTKAWDYAHLCKTYKKASEVARENHVPVLVHVEEVTQPQGHSTSGSHERYKSKERLAWEVEYDCIKQFKKWILENPVGENGKDRIANEETLEAIEKQAKKTVREAKGRAWKAFQDPIKAEMNEVVALINAVIAKSSNSAFLQKLVNDMTSELALSRKIVVSTVRKALRILRNEDLAEKKALLDWYNVSKIENHDRFNSYLYSQSAEAALASKAVAPVYAENSTLEDGRIILQENFDALFTKMPELVAFGEDAGKIGGVNQAFAGLQEKHGDVRLFDTGIREATIVGQGIGMALRGLRPIAEIQYLDYLLYGLQTLSDDLCTTHYRTKGGQKAPLLIRTRGHRFEGVWHAGSPMGMILNSLKGMYVCVPRDMTQAAGFYNTLLASDDPAIVIEPLNGYRLKEKLPTNLTEFKTPLGIPEVMAEGNDVTIVTYGSCFKIALAAVQQLKELGISVELIDVQTLIPFDVNHSIVESIKKTNRLVCLDEDHRGGASAYMLQHILEDQKGYFHLDSEPITIAAQDHRTAYGDDGDYFTNPSVEDVVEKIYELMSEAKPSQFKPIF